MNTSVSEKKRLRAQLRKTRESIPEPEIRDKSKAAQNWLIDSPEFEQARTIALYRACFGEVETDNIFKAARSGGKKALYPRTDKKNMLLSFAGIENLEDMVPGEWDIPEPSPESEHVPLEVADMVILPGVAFDRHGGRLGMGGGFYDRMLADLPEKVVRIGLAYDFQVVDKLVMDKYDQRVECLVTESGFLRIEERG